MMAATKLFNKSKLFSTTRSQTNLPYYFLGLGHEHCYDINTKVQRWGICIGDSALKTKYQSSMKNLSHFFMIFYFFDNLLL